MTNKSIEPFMLEISKSGQETISVPNIDGTGRKYLHSKHDPLKEAARFYAKNSVPDKSKLIILLGIGAGYYLRKGMELFPDRIWVVVEPDLAFHSWLRHNIDMSDILNNHSIYLIKGRNRAEWLDILDLVLTVENIPNIHIVKTPCIIDEKNCVEFIKTLQDAISFRKKNFTMYSLYAKTWIKQFFLNFPFIAQTNNIKCLIKNKKPYPAIAIGAGPSLRGFLPFLKDIKDNIYILSSDTAVPILLKEGIKPHIVISLDPRKDTSIHFERASVDSLTSVLTPEMYPSVFSLPWKNKVLINSYLPTSRWVNDNIFNLPEFRMGGNVISTILDVAGYMNMSPIYLIGVDFCFDDEMTHSDGTAYQYNTLKYLSKFLSFETLNSNRKRNETIYINIDKERVPTSDIYFQYAQWLLYEIENHPREYYRLHHRTLLRDKIPYFPPARLIKTYKKNVPELKFTKPKYKTTDMRKILLELKKDFNNSINNSLVNTNEWVSMPLAMNILEYHSIKNNPDKEKEYNESLTQSLLEWTKELMELIDNAVRNL